MSRGRVTARSIRRCRELRLFHELRGALIWTCIVRRGKMVC
jgi:hypothetical protein